MQHIFQAATSAVGSQKEDAAVLNRGADERNDIFVTDLRHLSELFAHVPGQIGAFPTNSFDGDEVASVDAGPSVRPFQTELTTARHASLVGLALRSGRQAAAAAVGAGIVVVVGASECQEQGASGDHRV